MRKLFIFAVFCFAVYSFVRNINDGNTDTSKGYDQINTFMQNNLPLDVLLNNDVQTKGEEAPEEVIEEKGEEAPEEVIEEKGEEAPEEIIEEKGEEKIEQMSEKISTGQMIGEPVIEKQEEPIAEPEMHVDANVLLDTKIIATMTPEKLSDILSKGANINARTQNGTTVLMIYSTLASVECVKVLLDNGADLNVVNSNGETALMAACQKNSKEVIKLLLQKGAKPYVQTTDGKTAFNFLENNENLSTEDRIEIYDMILQ